MTTPGVFSDHENRAVATSVPDVMAVDDVAVGAGASIVIAVAATLALTISVIVAALSTASNAKAEFMAPAAITAAADTAAARSAEPRSATFFAAERTAAAGEDRSLAPAVSIGFIAAMLAAGIGAGRALARAAGGSPTRIRRPTAPAGPRRAR